MKKLALCRVLSTFLFACVLVTSSFGQVLTTVAQFNGSNGDDPSSLVQGPDGNFYGTTGQGGDLACEAPGGCGTIFKMTPQGQITTLHTFELTDGWGPVGLVLGFDGNFYGVTVEGGTYSYGTIFKISMAGKLTTLHSFDSNDGSYPRGSLVQGLDGSFYGISEDGGDLNCIEPYGCGTVFKITPSGTLTTLHTFELSDGALPDAGLTLGTDGNFYGTTEFGGIYEGGFYGAGTVFKMKPDGTLTTLHLFCSFSECADGYQPVTALLQASDGKFYGTTSRSAPNYECSDEGCGTIFQITSQGQFGTVHVFKKTDGWDPEALIQATDSNLYGPADSGGDLTCFSRDGCGTLFNINATGNLTTLYEFEMDPGALPNGPLLQATSGTFYGSTYGGGVPLCFEGCGTVFSFSMGLGPFVSLVRNPAQVGQSVGVLGQGFTGITSVSVNGVPAIYTVKSDTALIATVPAGATTGFVTVTMPGGALTSNQPLYVLP